MTAAREKIIEAMTRAISGAGNCRDRFERCEAGACECRRDASAALAALAEQGYAVVPREADEEMILEGGPTASRHIWRSITTFADIARPDPAGEAKP